MPESDSSWSLAFLPPVDLKILYHYFNQHERWLLTYNNQWRALVAIGFAVGDVFGDGLGSIAKLTANGYDSPSPGDGIVTRWEQADTGGLLPVTTIPGQQLDYIQHGLEGMSFLFDPHDIDTYPGVIASIPFLLSQNMAFDYGIMVRIAWGMCQVKCAAMLANIFCIDNRGRPIT